MKPLLALVLVPGVIAGGGEEDGASTPPGLRGEIFGGPDLSGAPAAIRADSAVHFEWGAASPDPRLPRGPFSARWTGKVFVEEEGGVRFSAYVEGAVRVRVGGRVAPEGERSAPGWVPGVYFRLEHGLHDIEITYRRT